METAGAADIPENAERKGIGTPATRAAILEKLIETKLIERIGEKRKKVLVPTTKGKALAAVLPESLRSPLLTSAWEQRLQQIEQGVEKSEDFMRDIQAFVKELTVNPQRVEHAETLPQMRRGSYGASPRVSLRKPYLRIRTLEKGRYPCPCGNTPDCCRSKDAADKGDCPQNRLALHPHQRPL